MAPVNDGLIHGHDVDTVRRSLLELEADHAKMKKTLEETVKEAEVIVFAFVLGTNAYSIRV